MSVTKLSEPAITLTYWNTRAICEPIRLLLHYLHVPFVDRRLQVGPPPEYSKLEWDDDPSRPLLDFPNLPHFHDRAQGTRLTQTHAILIHIAREHGMCGHSQEEEDRALMTSEAARDWINDLFYVTYCSAGSGDPAVHARVLGQCSQTSPEFERRRSLYLEGTLPLHLSKFERALGPGWVAGNNLTYADFVVFETLDQHLILDPTCLPPSAFPRLARFWLKFSRLPAIRTYRDGPLFQAEPLHNRYSHFHTGWLERDGSDSGTGLSPAFQHLIAQHTLDSKTATDQAYAHALETDTGKPVRF